MAMGADYKLWLNESFWGWLEDLDFNTCIKLINAYFLFITEYDTDGNVVQSWHSTDPMMSKICEGFVHNGYMYLGSPYNMFAARVPYYH